MIIRFFHLRRNFPLLSSSDELSLLSSSDELSLLMWHQLRCMPISNCDTSLSSNGTRCGNVGSAFASLILRRACTIHVASTTSSNGTKCGKFGSYQSTCSVLE
ncbi:hypothetical protein Adt_05068 [Abeliophyllum distichum]|uniref:Uncharacterized protein n=1 Tax=Abeliophyllum distichum TaxID=126358 RepID=A0ABD1V319_9LAMI